MEIIFNNVTIVKNRGTNFQKTIINDFSLSFKSNIINCLCGNGGKTTIAKSILALENITDGEIHVGDFIINKSAFIRNIKKLRSSVSYLGKDPRTFLYHKTVKKEIMFGFNPATNMTILEVLSLVGLNESYLKKDPLKLSLTEQKKVCLASIIAFNPKIIILDEFEKGLTKYEKKELKRILKDLKTKLDKTIVIISNDVTFIHNFCEYFYCLSDGKLVLTGDKEIFNNKEFYKYTNEPNIIEFVNYLNSRGIKMPNYIEPKELLKAVYRDVG